MIIKKSSDYDYDLVQDMKSRLEAINAAPSDNDDIDEAIAKLNDACALLEGKSGMDDICDKITDAIEGIAVHFEKPSVDEIASSKEVEEDVQDEIEDTEEDESDDGDDDDDDDEDTDDDDFSDDWKK
jgi:hypothetical protein